MRAVIIGLRTNASAIAVPTPIVRVAAAAAAAGTNALRCSSLIHKSEKPADSAATAASTTSAIVSPQGA